MTDDLVKRLRDNMKDVDAYESHISNAMEEAADRFEQLEAAYAQQQQVWSDAIARADRYEAALREIIMCWNYEQCAELARAALGEKE